MSNGTSPTVTRVTQDQTLDATGKVVTFMRVIYMVGDHGPFMLSIPAVEFSAAGAQALMQATADEISKLTASA